MTDNKSNINTAVGQRIRTLRKVLGLSQNDVASQVGFSYQQLQKYEKGQSRMALDTLERITTVLGTSVEDIIRPIYGSDVGLNKASKVMSESRFSSRLDILSAAVLEDKQVQSSLIELLQAIDQAATEKAD